MSIKIVIGSVSKLKLVAVQTAARFAEIDAEVVGVPVVSAVAAQPSDLDETHRGADHRARAARNDHDAQLYFGIESGIHKVSTDDGPRWEDVTAVVMLDPSRGTFTHWSQGVMMPDDAVEEARERGFVTHTVGEVLAERLKCPAYDPHWVLTGHDIDRESIVANAVAELLFAWKSGFPGSILPVTQGIDITWRKTHHVMELDGERRALPIRELEPGVPAAIFDIRGDRLMARAAGYALARRLKEGPDFDVIMMPAGKAENLAQIVGDKLMKDLVIPVKDVKVWMDDMVAIPVDTVTSRPQTLHVTKAQLEFLRGKRVCFLDDVISSEASVEACAAILRHAEATMVRKACVFLEGDPRPDIVSLRSLPFPYPVF